MSDLSKLQEEMVSLFNDLATCVGEDPHHAKIEELFNTMTQFVDSFHRCIAENEKRAEDEARKERIAKKRAEIEAKRKSVKEGEETSQADDNSPVAITSAKRRNSYQS